VTVRHDLAGIHWTGCDTIHPACADVEAERARIVGLWADDIRDYDDG
jgi:hypothetical protein